ncbi:hypothetical protein BsIDN1_38700 [Bacillus safensis]|uniref:Uncharacterized protein n=1 Tax=Bacillus safensis TaxID=561879 RepID=A0A5S9MCF0_BACIA|nr:hypothetical protein BsIDN1_38700 [Bacillus safensis]
MTTSHSLASITTGVTEDEQNVYIEIQFPDHFVEGDIALEVKSPIFTLISTGKNQNRYDFFVFKLYQNHFNAGKKK